MRVECPKCGDPVSLDDQSAGKTVRCTYCGRSFVAPQELAVTGQHHTLQIFPVSAVVVLHYITGGLFSIIYLNLLHDRMPKIRESDPSAMTAIGLSFVPIVNIGWFFFSYHRLCRRINEQRRFAGLPETAPIWLSVPVCVLLGCGMLVPFFSTAGGLGVLGATGLVAMPLFAALIQNSINDLCEHPDMVPGISL